MAENIETGKKGEELACEFLQKKGYTILNKNWRYGHKEIDIIARIANILVVVEVKTRTKRYFDEPDRAVNKEKQKFLVKAINAYVQWNKIDLEIRFDIVSILLSSQNPEIEHIIDAFYPMVNSR